VQKAIHIPFGPAGRQRFTALRFEEFSRGAWTFFRSILMRTGALSLAFSLSSLSQAENSVLDRHQVQFEDKSITYDRIETPVLKPPSPSGPPVTEPPPLPPTAAELEALRQWEAKTHLDLFLSVTRYDNGISEVQFWHEGGGYVFWSNLNFGHLRNVIDFETPQSVYWFLLATGDQRLSDLAAWNAEVQAKGLSSAWLRAIPILSSGVAQPGYVLISSPPTGARPEALQAIEDLHRYYDAQKTELIRQFEQSEAARRAQEEYLLAHPPQPKPTVIQYFPIRSSSKRGEAR
jgi:hypothetical protein